MELFLMIVLALSISLSVFSLVGGSGEMFVKWITIATLSAGFLYIGHILTNAS